MTITNSQFMGEFSTAAKYAVQNWTRFATLVNKYGAAPKDSSTAMPQTAVLLDVFNGGFSFCFREWVALLVKIEQVLILLRDWKENTTALTPDLIKQFHCEGVEITKVALAKVEKLRKKLLADMKKQDKQLQALHAQAGELVLKQLEAQRVVLSPQQQQQFSSVISRRALYHHLTQAKQQPFDKAAVLSYSDYFRYKTLLILSSGQANSAQQLKQLEPCFQQIEKLAQQWVDEHIQPMQQQLQDALKAQETV